MPALAVTTLLQERATASARWPTRGGGGRRDQRRGVEPGHAQHGEAGRRIPAGELRVERAPVVAAHVQAVFAAERAHGGQHDVVSVDEPARRAAAALHLDDGWGRRAHGVGELIRERCEKVSSHAPIVAEGAPPRITQTGSGRYITRAVRRSAVRVRRSTFDVRGSWRAYATAGCSRRGAWLRSAPVRAQRPVISIKPDTPFKLATFEAAGKVRVGLVLGTRMIDIEGAHAMIVQELALRGAPAMPRDMRDADRELRASRRASTGSRTTSRPPSSTRAFVFDVEQGRDQGADQVSLQHPGGRRQLQAARRRDVPAGQPAAEGGQRSRSGQGRSGVLRQVAALVHHRSGRELRHPAWTEHRLGRRAGDHHRQAGVQGRPRRRRTTTCSATASCTTSAIAAAPAGGR